GLDVGWAMSTGRAAAVTAQASTPLSIPEHTRSMDTFPVAIGSPSCAAFPPRIYPTLGGRALTRQKTGREGGLGAHAWPLGESHVHGKAGSRRRRPRALRRHDLSIYRADPGT